MKSLKVKLTSALTMVFVAIAMLIVGIYAAQTQTITMQGSVNFDIADKCLYVQDVRMQEDNNAEPYSLKEQGRFMPGYINGNFNMNLGTFTNTYGSFALYFDIINTMDETSGETFAYTVVANPTQSGVTVGVSILDNNNSNIEQIPQGTVKPSQITQDTTLSASVKVTISTVSGISVDLSQITITINQYVPKVYDGFEFTINGDTATIEDYTGTDTEIVIPSTISRREDGAFIEGSEYKVTSIGTMAFYNCGSLTSVTIPDTVTIIDDLAFDSCNNLTSVTFEENSQLTKISYNAFDGCISLTNINLSICTKLTSIDVSAFAECSSLTYINIPYGVTIIGNDAFNGCSSLLNVTIPDSVTNIGDGVFYGCSSLTSVTIGSGVEGIGLGVFYNCNSLTSATFKETNGWQFQPFNDKGWKDIIEDLSDKTIAAECLKNTYESGYWRRVVN